MIELKHVSKKFGNKAILNDVSFTIQPGEVTLLVGENGSGKTTLLNLIMQLIPQGKGEILYNNQPITFNDYHKISYVPDQIIVLKHLTISEALQQMKDYYATFNEKRAYEILEFFNLNANDKINQLSKGNVAKVNILLGLSLDSDFILMDEPFSGIDIFTREEILSVFTSKLIEGQGVLISSHDIPEIEYIVDKAILMRDGMVIDEIIPEQLRQERGISLVDKMREVYR